MTERSILMASAMALMIDRNRSNASNVSKSGLRAAIIMRMFNLTAIAALTLWGIVYLLLKIFVGEHPNFPGQNIIEFVLNSALLLIVGWMAVGVAYATSPFRIDQSTAFATCIISMAIFAYLIAFSTHKKILQPPKTLEKKIDRMIVCKNYPRALGC